MGYVSALEAFEILVKDDKASMLKKIGEEGIDKIRDRFIDVVADNADVNNEVDVDDSFVKKDYNNVVSNTAY